MSRAAAFLLVLTAWTALSGSLAPPDLALGALLALLVLFLLRHHLDHPRLRVRPLGLVLLFLLFLKEFALSVLAVTATVLRPRLRLDPRMVSVPTALEGEFRVALLANLITLTPGTLTVDISDDGRTLHVHALDCADPEALRRGIAEGFERRIREAFP